MKNFNVKLFLFIIFIVFILLISCTQEKSTEPIIQNDSLEYYFEVNYKGEKFCSNCQVWLNTVYRGEINYEGEIKKFKAENGMNTYKLRYGSTDFINYFMLNPDKKFYRMDIVCP